MILVIFRVEQVVVLMKPMSWFNLQVALGPGGVVEGITPGKGYVDMSTVDSATSLKIAEVWVLHFLLLICYFSKDPGKII